MMFRILFKKQFLEVISRFTRSAKTGKRRSKISSVIILALCAVSFICISGMFVSLSLILCGPLCDQGMDWFYFSVMELFALMIGVFLSIFSTYSSLYKPKDNELLLSMPIKPFDILKVRLVGVWLWGMLFEACVFIPAAGVYWYVNGINPQTAVCLPVIFIAISMLILMLSCFLGWIIALISSKIRSRSAITVLVSVVFLGIYYYLCSTAYEKMQILLINAIELGEKIKGGAGYPLYIAGNAATGNILQTAIFFAISVALVALTAVILAKSFVSFTTTAKSAKKKKFDGTVSKQTGITGALLYKELKRFTRTPAYMLNCGLGTLLIPIAAVILYIKSDDLLLFTFYFDEKLLSIIPLAACAAICVLSSMNDISAPSISLEGKQLYILRSIPVAPWSVLKAKILFHLILTEPPIIFCSAVIIKILMPTVLQSVLLIALPCLFVIFTAMTGILLGLKMPNLDWQNEAVPLKQSASVMISVFGGWGIVLALGTIYYLLMDSLSPDIYMIICTVLFAAADAALYAYLKKRGTQIFASL